MDVETGVGSGASSAADGAAAPPLPKTLLQALEAARAKLLDRSLRNKLIHTNVASSKSRQVRVIDEKSTEVFELLRSGKLLNFAPGAPSRVSTEAPDEEEVLYIPPTDAVDDDGVASRHRDQKLQTRLTPEGLQRKLLSLYHEGQTIEEEQGVNVLYLALGFLRWREAKRSEVDRYAPLVLLPVELLRDGARDRFKLKLRPDDLFTNVSLQAWLKEQFGVSLPDISDADDFSIGGYYAQVAASIGSRQGWEVIEDEILLGFFSFSKFLLWRDLDPANWPRADQLLGHPLLSQILTRATDDAEDTAPAPLIGDDQNIDEVFRPADLVHITDADSSQAIAIEEALSGRNLVIQGPPGTGKSQTITNIIAGAVARGKSVLFIAEKMAALDVVHSRLQKANVDATCLELHSRKASKTQFLEQVKRAMSMPAPPAWPKKVFAELEETQQLLREHSSRLHRQGSAGFSAFDIFGRITKIKREGARTPDFELRAAQEWDAEQFQIHSKRIDALAARTSIAGVPNLHPWRGSGIPSPDLLQQDRLRPLVDALQRSVEALAEQEASASDILRLEGSAPLGKLHQLAAALTRLSERPFGLDDLLTSDEFIQNRDAIDALIASGERLAELRPLVNGYGGAYEMLRCLEPARVAPAWTLLAQRPDGRDELLLDRRICERRAELTRAVAAAEALEQLREQLRAEVIGAAHAEDWLPVRRALAAHGTSWLRWFSGEYRKALRSLASVCLASGPSAHADRLALLDRLLEHERLKQQVEAAHDDLQLLAPLWNEERCDWPALREVLDWVRRAAEHEPQLCLQTEKLFRAIDDSDAWPAAAQEQEDLLGQLGEAGRLSAEIASNEAARRALGEHWQWDHTQWQAIRAALSWREAAKAFEPSVRLRDLDVLRRSGEAETAAKGITEAEETTRRALERLVAAFQIDLEQSLLRGGIDDCSARDLSAVTRWWQSDFARITEWPQIRDDLAWLREIGCAPLAERVFDGRVSPGELSNIFSLAAYEAIWQRLRVSVPELESTVGEDLARVVARFRTADMDRIRVASDEVRRAHLDRCPTGSAGAVGLLKDETKKSRRLKPVRKLMEEAGEAVQRFKPVFLMSPLSVAQFLTPGRLQFDLCVIDEASQVRPEDAIGAIARCKQLVVVGDDKQLPPTNFFSRMVNDDSADADDEDSLEEGSRAAAVKDVESILNLCSRFPERMLRWHYRSEHPSLIATSNRNFYKNELMLPPAVITGAGDGHSGLLFHKVAENGYERGKTARNELEAETVAQAALQHARQHPDQSLGIGTFSVAQRDAIRDRLDILAAKHPDLDTFLRKGARDEKTFVKNLENIQGDERDVIFISVGYGRDKDGRLTQQFGPVGRDGGERRLNVLITRARKRCEVFSSLVAEDIKMDGAPKPGVAALREFLKLAKDGYADLPEQTQRGFDSDFEEAVAIAIRELGYDVHPQVGMAGFFVDLGVIDPRAPNRYLLGIECDGAAYHSSRYARDRDRLRQHILESRGWRIHRIWSTDWFYRQDREIARIKAALETALSGNDLPKAQDVFEPTVLIEPEMAKEVVQAELLELPPESGRFIGYEMFSEIAGEAGSVEPHELTDERLGELAVTIVRLEQPIHEEEVARRLTGAFQLQRAGVRIRSAAMRGLKFAARRGLLSARNGFWRETDGREVHPRDRSALPAAATARKAELICPSEIAAAVRHVLRASLALESQELVVETARALGFARTGGDISAAIQAAIQAELRDEVRTDHLNRVELLV